MLKEWGADVNRSWAREFGQKGDLSEKGMEGRKEQEG